MHDFSALESTQQARAVDAPGRRQAAGSARDNLRASFDQGIDVAAFTVKVLRHPGPTYLEETIPMPRPEVRQVSCR
jgi:hypothetical protein